MAEVIGAELHFETIGCMRQWARHNAGVIDQNIDARLRGDEIRSSASYTGEIA